MAELPTFIVALKQSVGTSSESPSSFMADYKKLSKEDKEWYYKAMQDAGIQCQPPK